MMRSSPGIAVRRTASLPLAYDRATQYSRASMSKRQRSGILGHPLSRVVTVEAVERRCFFYTATLNLYRPQRLKMPAPLQPRQQDQARHRDHDADHEKQRP